MILAQVNSALRLIEIPFFVDADMEYRQPVTHLNLNLGFGKHHVYGNRLSLIPGIKIQIGFVNFIEYPLGAPRFRPINPVLKLPLVEYGLAADQY
ncbi:hypothetical protein D3C73_1243850 [compost metagenome]